MQVTISPSKAHGTVAAPPSKSMAHRYLIAAAMANGNSTVEGISSCEDVSATLDCLASLGVVTVQIGETVKVCGKNLREAEPHSALYCRESGSTLRFMLPIALLSGRETTLVGAPSLMRRPMQIYKDICLEKGLYFSQCENTVTVKGPLSAGDYTLPGNVSSQFITGLLLALAAVGESRIHILPPFESRSYIDLTVFVMREFGVAVEWEDAYTLHIPSDSFYQAHPCTVEGDHSNAAFLEALRYFGGDVTVTGLCEDSLQGDRVYRTHFAALENGRAEIDLSDCPDLGPILFAFAAAKHGGSFTGTRRLRIKESDRAAAMAKELAKFGARVTVEENRVTVHPSVLHTPTELLSAHNDHRIVMSLACLATTTGGTIVNAEAVNKSYPEFFDDLRSLGIACRADA